MTAAVRLTLHDLGEAQDVLDRFLLEFEGEQTPEIAELWDLLSGQIDEKVERYALWIRGQQGQADLIKVEEERLYARRKAIENGIKRGKENLQHHMERLGRDKVKGKLVTVAIQANAMAVKGDLSPEALEIIYRSGPAIVKHVPESYALDKAAALAAFKAGQTLPAGLSVEQSHSIRIR